MPSPRPAPPLWRKVLYSAIPLLVLAVGATVVLRELERRAVIDVNRSDELAMSGQTDLMAITQSGRELVFTNDDAHVNLTVPRRKADREFRIVLIGGSMAMGIPYTDHGAGDTAKWMQALLEARFPSRLTTVINACIGGMTSLGVVETVELTASLQPDVVIVLSGNNEGYVPDPVNRTVHRWVVYRALRKTLLAEPEPWEHPDFYPQDERVAQIDGMFRDNLTRVVELTRESDTPLVLSTLPTNMKWMGEVIPGAGNPYTSREYPSMRPDTAISEGLRLCAAGDHQGAVDAFYRSDEHYTAGLALGQCLEDMGDHAAALETYRSLVETYPMGRVRPALNDIVREVGAASKDVVFTDLEAGFLALDDQGLPDPTMFLDNCHLTAVGNFWVAQHLIAAMIEHGLVAGAPDEPHTEPDMRALARQRGWAHLFQPDCPGGLDVEREETRLAPAEPPAPAAGTAGN